MWHVEKPELGVRRGVFLYEINSKDADVNGETKSLRQSLDTFQLQLSWGSEDLGAGEGTRSMHSRSLRAGFGNTPREASRELKMISGSDKAPPLLGLRGWALDQEQLRQ